MEYASFYGGRRGTSFIIVKNYLDIPSMVADFIKGGSFTGVNYDQYVLINTINKNHPDNGKIFRRGYDYNSTRTIQAYHAYDESGKEIINGTPEQYKNAIYQYDQEFPAGGAIYSGTIVGPAGRAPQVSMTTYQIAQNKHASQGFDQQKSSGQYSTLNDLLPGKYVENGQIKYNDAIQWFCTSIRDNFKEDSQAYVGFKIPYPVIDYTTTVVDPYNADDEYADMTNITRTDDMSHPYYEAWNIDIPRGIKGDSIKNFRVMVPSELDQIYTIGTENIYPDFLDDVLNHRNIIVYDYYNYDDLKEPKQITYYIGKYNQITDFTIDNNGTVTVAFTHDDPVIYTNLIKWVTNITLNEDADGNSHPGRLIINYNYGDSEIYDLDWVKNIRFNTDGTVYIDYTISNSTEYPKLIKWINDISLATQNEEPSELNPSGITEGTFSIKYNDGTQLIEYLKWVNNITLSDTGKLTLHYSGGKASQDISTVEGQNFIKWINDINLLDDGTLTVVYNTQEQEDVPDTKTFDKTIKWITGINFDNSGNIIVNYNTGTTDIYEKQLKWIQNVSLTKDGLFTIQYNQGNIPDYTTRLKWPTNVNINTAASGSTSEGTGTQKVEITYTTGQKQQIGSPLNYILKTKITSDKHLIILYADPAKRQALINNNQAYYVGGTNPYRIDGYDGWLDLGSIYTDSGILIGLNLTAQDIINDTTPGKPTIENDPPHQDDIINYLNFKYSNGLTGAGINGKVVTVGEEGQDKAFFGFNYNLNEERTGYKGWYYLGMFSSVATVMSLESIEPTIQTDGLWLVIEQTCSIVYNLTNVESTNKVTVLSMGFEYTTKLIGANLSVSVIMGNRDVTSLVYNSTTSTININSSNINGVTTITGDIIINASGS